MKNIKFILLLLCFSAVLTSCSDDDEPAYELSNVNIAGTYGVNSLEFQEEETATSSSGNTVKLSSSTSVTDTFSSINFILNANGSYTASGEYRITTTTTPNGGSTSTDDPKIISFNTAGNYAINSIDKKIKFIPTSGDFVNNEYTITTFNTNSIKMTKSSVDVDGGNTVTSKQTVGLVRK